MKNQNVKLNGYTGRWSQIEDHYFEGRKVFFMEHDTYGDETCYLIVKENLITKELQVMAETYDGFLETLANIKDYLI